MPRADPPAVRYDASTQDVRVLIDADAPRVEVRGSCVPLYATIPIVIIALVLGAVLGVLFGFFIVPCAVLVPLQWSLFFGASGDGKQNVDAIMYRFRTGKILKTRKTKWCKPLRGCECRETYDAFERILILLRIIKVKDDNNQRYIQGTSESRRKLDGTWIFYILLCSPMVMGLCASYFTYLLVVHFACANNNYENTCLRILVPVACGGCFLLLLATLGLHKCYRSRLRYLDENLVENFEENPAENIDEDLDENLDDNEMSNQETEEMAADFMDRYNEILEKMQNDKASDVPLTQEEENWVKLSFLLVEEGTQWVAKIMIHYLQEHNMTFQQLLDANKKQLYKMTAGTGKPGQKTLFSSDQINLLFPEAKLAEVDLTLLVLLIGVLRILDPPPCKWTAKKDPPDTDTDQASDLVRLRLMRNHLYAHIVECAIATDEFESHWEKLLAILVRFGAVVTELDKLKDRETTREEARQMSKRITTLFRGDIPDAEEFAKEKMKELAENHKARPQHQDPPDDIPPGMFI